MTATKLAEDDDSGGVRNARITYTARTDAVHRLFATSFRQSGMGDFTLRVRANE